MNKELSLLSWIQEWFHNNCDGDWEHDQKIIITNLDNPGWCVTINLEDTDLQTKEFEKISIDRSEDDWFTCRIENHQFLGDGGTFNLIEIIEVFRAWALSNS